MRSIEQPSGGICMLVDVDEEVVEGLKGLNSESEKDEEASLSTDDW